MNLLQNISTLSDPGESLSRILTGMAVVFHQCHQHQLNLDAKVVTYLDSLTHARIIYQPGYQRCPN